MKKRYLPYLFAGVALLIALFSIAGFSGDSKHLAAAKAGGDYLISHMHDDGSFVYEYDPVTKQESDEYNILRHAGTTYALLELYEATKEQKYLTAALDGLVYLIVESEVCPFNENATCIVENGEIKLGGNGLALLAFSKYLEVGDNTLLGKIGTHFTREGFEVFAEELALGIIGMQSPNGEFTIHKLTNGVVDDFESEYYPGEAMFALARFSQVSGDRTWLDAAHKGALWIVNVRDKEVPTTSLPHDHWFLYALNELTKDQVEDVYIEHAHRLVQAIVATQHEGLTGEKALWNGGYYNPPRSTPTATRNEGLGAAYELFTRVGDGAYAEVAKDAMEKGIAFTLRTQDKNGGFHESLEDHTIRIDYVQHNISALLAFERMSKEK